MFKIPILRGRFFNERDDAGALPVAIINQSMARQFWPKGDPLYEQLMLGKGYGPEFEEPARQIIGVVKDVHDFGLNRNPGPIVYVPMAQITDGITAVVTRASSLVWIVRIRTAPHKLAPVIESEIQQVNGGLPVAGVRSMGEVMIQSTASADFNMSLLTVFACSALLLASIGIYGLMAYVVRERTQELAIRMALGAETNHVRNMVIVEGMRLALIGIATGMVAAFGLTRFLARFLFGVKVWDAVVFTTVPVLLGAVALLAVWIPAFRASCIDPVQALRPDE